MAALESLYDIWRIKWLPNKSQTNIVKLKPSTNV